MSSDKEQSLLKIIELLVAQTNEGSLEWDERFGNTFQAVLGNQTLVLENPKGTIVDDVLPALIGIPVVRPGASLEIRDKKGAVIERIKGPDRMRGVAVPTQTLRETIDPTALRPKEHSVKVTRAVNALYDVVINRKEAISDAALEELLENLQGRNH